MTAGRFVGPTRRRLILATLAVMLMGPLLAGMATAACRDDTIDLRGDWGAARFTVEIADDDASRALGLMHRETLPRSAGMLFVFEDPRRATFWMKDTLIELDMLFADPQGRITHVHQRAQPRDLTPISGGENVQYVLEINGGMAAQLGIAEGSTMRHPAIDPALAAWSCE